MEAILQLVQSRGAEILLLALVLSAARPLAFIMVSPLFTRFGLQEGLIRGGILLAFAAPVMPGVMAELQTTGSLPIPSVALLLLKELGIGLITALVLGIPLWAVAAAGDFLDMQRGASMAQLVEPGTGEQISPTGTLFFLLMTLVLVASGWFTEVLMATLYETYAAWPVLEPLPPISPEVGAGVLSLLDALIRTGLVLAIPILVPLLLAEIALAVAGKYTQQLNVMFLAMSLKQVIFLILLPIYFSALLYYMRGEVRDLGDATEVLRGFLGTVP